MEYGTIDGCQFTTFQYDNMGDYVRATNLFVQDKTDEERFEHIKRLLGYCAQGTMTQKEKEEKRQSNRQLILQYPHVKCGDCDGAFGEQQID